MSEHEMKIELMDPNELHPYANNPRVNDGAVDAVAASIKEFGFKQVIVVDSNLEIICGHTRVKAAQKLGLAKVPVHIARDLTADQIKAYRIADNRTGEIAEWDYKLLPVELAELQDADFDLSLLGFDESELDKLLNGDMEDVLMEGETEPDAVPDTPEIADSRRGQVYRLGDHLLMCGDAIDAGDVAKLMGETAADLWLTDPPYNVAYSNSLGQTIENDNMDDGQFRAFLNSSFSRAVKMMKPGASYYIFHADTEGYNFRGACRDVGLKVRECLIWVKNALVLGRCDYHFRHEPCLYGWKDGAAHNWYSDRCQTTVLEFHKPTQNIGHPTSKPVEMLVYLIKNSSQRGDLVIDTFGGSGSTLIACEQTGRVCRMMELDERYCDVIRRRWAEFVHSEGCDWQEKTPAIKSENNN